jgi:hypothetical protein
MFAQKILHKKEKNKFHRELDIQIQAGKSVLSLSRRAGRGTSRGLRVLSAESVVCLRLTAPENPPGCGVDRGGCRRFFEAAYLLQLSAFAPESLRSNEVKLSFPSTVLLNSNLSFDKP